MHLTQNWFFMQINFSEKRWSIQIKDGNVKCVTKCIKTFECTKMSHLLVWTEAFSHIKRCIQWKLATIYVLESISTPYLKHLLTKHFICSWRIYALTTTINKQQVICHSPVRRWVNFICFCYQSTAVICDHWITWLTAYLSTLNIQHACVLCILWIHSHFQSSITQEIRAWI